MNNNTEQIETLRQSNKSNDIKSETNNKRKFTDNNNNKKPNNNNNKKSNNNNNNNKNKSNKKQRLKYTHDYNYKLISPFQKYLDFSICPTLNDLYTEFYHILNEGGGKQKECKCLKLKNELDELKRINKGEIEMPIDFNFNLRHHHTKEEIDSIVFDPNDRERIELTVRKFCGFLQKESNMVLMEMIILSIGLLKSIEFLHFTLEVERDGGIYTTTNQQKQNNSVNNIIENNCTTATSEALPEVTTPTTTTTLLEVPIKRRRTPGGVFYKLINLHLPTGFKSNLFSMSSLFKYRNERKKKGFGTLVDLRDKLLDFTSNNNNNNNSISNNNNTDGNGNIKNLNTLLNEVDEEFDKLCISSKNEEPIMI